MPKNMKRKSKEEVQAWVEDKKTKRGEKMVVRDENTESDVVPHIKVEVEKL